MKQPASILIGIAACAWVVSALAVATPVAQSPPPPQNGSANAAASDPSAGLFAQMCNKCHDAARITAMRRTSTEWEEVINKMIEKGATGSEKEFETIYTYVLRYYGKLYINNATSDDITTILGLSKKDAETIVAYRKANGSFADFDAIKKVPDIDLKKLDEQKDAVAF
jgi:competence ComEA-like helix-hairpin-helix protein